MNTALIWCVDVALLTFAAIGLIGLISDFRNNK